jgi:rubrerythrin
MVDLPAGAPETLGAAFAHIGQIKTPTILDMKVMVLVEAAGQTLYENISQGTDNPAVRDLLLHNGREEMVHAHRVSKAIEAITGESFLPPAAANNPYCAGPMPSAPMTPEGLRGTAKGEFGGEALYEGWAASMENEEAARLFRLNGKEEADHGNRLLEAALLLEA